MADEDAPIEDTPVEDAPAEDTSVEDAPAEDAAETGSADDGSTSAREPRWRTARVAAVVAGAVLASAAAVTGAVWAISAIVDDDDDYDDCCYGDYATSIDPEDLRGAERDWGPRPDRDRGERRERRGERFDRERGKRFDRDRSDRGERAERDKRGPDKEREERYGSKEADGSEPDQADAAEGCTTIHRFGSGENAVTILVCKAPDAEWPEFKPGDEGGYFRFRKAPRDAFPFFGRQGEQWPFLGRQRPFGPGLDGEPFGEDGLLPFDLEEFLEDRFDRGEREFRFRGDGEDGRQGSFCFRNGDEERCFGDFGQLSDEEREQLEQMMEMLDGFGLGDFLGGLLDSLDDLELELPESQTDPSGATGA